MKWNDGDAVISKTQKESPWLKCKTFFFLLPQVSGAVCMMRRYTLRYHWIKSKITRQPLKKLKDRYQCVSVHVLIFRESTIALVPLQKMCLCFRSLAETLLFYVSVFIIYSFHI